MNSHILGTNMKIIYSTVKYRPSHHIHTHTLKTGLKKLQQKQAQFCSKNKKLHLEKQKKLILEKDYREKTELFLQYVSVT